MNQNKYIFVDIWTPWCGVCKIYDRAIFPRKDVGECFNKEFVNITFDAETTVWAPVATKFNATSFPTMLVLNPQGEVVWSMENLGVPRLTDLEAPTSEVADRLMRQALKAKILATLSDNEFVSQANWDYLKNELIGFDTKIFARMVQLKDELMKRYPKEFNRVMARSLGSASSNMTVSVNHKPVPNRHKMEQFRQIVKQLNLPDKAATLADMEINVALRTRQWRNALQMARQSETELPTYTYAAIAGDMLDGCTDKALLQEAVRLTGKVFRKQLSERERKYIVPVYNQLVEASGIADAAQYRQAE